MNKMMKFGAGFQTKYAGGNEKLNQVCLACRQLVLLALLPNFKGYGKQNRGFVDS